MSDPSEPTDGNSSDDDPSDENPADTTAPDDGGTDTGAFGDADDSADSSDGGPADGTPGWYLDRDDPALARWHDGDEWTEHTLVIADQPAGADPPPPPSIRRPSHAAILRERAMADAERKASRSDGLPKWAPIAVAVVVGLIAAGLFTFLKGDDDKATTVGTDPVSIDKAVDLARTSGFPSQIGDSRASGLIEDLCEAADRPARTATLSADLARLSLTPTQLNRTIGALGEGAKAYCPDERAGIISTVAQLQAQASGSTTTTFPSVDGGVVDGSVSTLPGDSTSTTKKPTTATTKKPTPTTAGPTTTASTTTTTIAGVLPGSKCSTKGDKSVSKIDRSDLTCDTFVCGSGTLSWRKSACTTPQTAPTN